MLLGVVTLTGTALAWGGRGHSTIAALADRHLTDRARKNIQAYTGGRSIVYFAAWMDHNRRIAPYEETHFWHVDYNNDALRKDAEGNPAPPMCAYQANRVREEMTDFRSMSDSAVLINIKYLVHLLGDMHCPSHVNYPASRAKIKLNGKKLALHKVWDSQVMGIMHPNLGAIEQAEMLDIIPEKEAAEIVKGSVYDWFAESELASKRAVELVPEDKNLTVASYLLEAEPIARLQMQKAGLRLAFVLNEIFDK